MGYVEEIQKINKLARELMSHGMASSLDEAVNKAKDMLKNNVELARIPNPSQVYQQQKQQQNQPEISVQAAKPEEVNPGLNNTVVQQDAKDKTTGMTWQQAMSKNNEYIVGMMKKYEEQMGIFKQNIVDLSKELDKLKESQKLSQVIRKEPGESQQKFVKQEDKPERKPASSPRSGDYKPGDVAIEKMFYFGNKR